MSRCVAVRFLSKTSCIIFRIFALVWSLSWAVVWLKYSAKSLVSSPASFWVKSEVLASSSATNSPKTSVSNTALVAAPRLVGTTSWWQIFSTRLFPCINLKSKFGRGVGVSSSTAIESQKRRRAMAMASGSMSSPWMQLEMSLRLWLALSCGDIVLFRLKSTLIISCKSPIGNAPEPMAGSRILRLQSAFCSSAAFFRTKSLSVA